mgnify:CR=1 FL=1
MRFLARCALVLLLAAVCLPFFGCAAPAAPEPEGEISLTARFQDGGGDALSSGCAGGRARTTPWRAGSSALRSFRGARS